MFQLELVLVLLVGFSSQQTIEIWRSDPVKGTFLQKGLTFLTFQTDNQANAQYTINVDPNVKYQQMDGFGASLTDASAWLFRNKLSTIAYADILSKLFTSNGINLSLLRQPIGSSDFNWEAWSYDDTVNNNDDFCLSSFSLWREDAYIRPVLDQILSISQGRLKLMGSPWSPPAWMKTKKHLNGNIGGSLRTDCYDVYADYLVEYLKAYDAKGSKVYGITVQNEPQYAPAYPGMLMSSSEQIKFIAYHLGPKLTASGLGTKIIGFDHNYDPQGLQYSDELLSNPEANKYIAGIGFHTYTTPNHIGMTNLHNKYQNKEIWITEAGSGTWIGNNLNQFQDQMMHLIRSPRNWAKGVIFWNLALDQNSGPKLAGVDTSNVNRGLITIRSDTVDSINYEMGYYSMGHSSKLMNPGAYRIESNTNLDEVENVAYLNPDKTIVLIISNRTGSKKDVKVKFNSKAFSLSLDPYNAVTMKWSLP